MQPPLPIPYPVIDPDDQTAASPLAQALIANQHDPKAWVFTSITDWSGPEAKDIRYEIAALLPDHTVKFRGAVHDARRGTAMHIVPRSEVERGV